jgi:hypothetical protein
MALYQFEAAQVTASGTERTYRYVRSLPSQQAQEYLAAHNEWKFE